MSLRAAGYLPVPSHAHHPALDPAEAPEFMTALRAIPSMDARLLEFTILTVARAARRARRGSIRSSDACLDRSALAAERWPQPQGQPFRVPLSPRALEIVDEMRALHPGRGADFRRRARHDADQSLGAHESRSAMA